MIRNLDDAVVVSLKAKAKAAGLSLEQYLRDNLTEIALPSKVSFLEKARQFREKHSIAITLEAFENAMAENKSELEVRGFSNGGAHQE